MMNNSYVRIIDITNERNLSTHGPLYNSTSYHEQQFCKYQLISKFNQSSGNALNSTVKCHPNLLTLYRMRVW